MVNQYQRRKTLSNFPLAELNLLGEAEDNLTNVQEGDSDSSSDISWGADAEIVEDPEDSLVAKLQPNIKSIVVEFRSVNMLNLSKRFF